MGVLPTNVLGSFPELGCTHYKLAWVVSKHGRIPRKHTINHKPTPKQNETGWLLSRGARPANIPSGVRKGVSKGGNLRGKAKSLTFSKLYLRAFLLWFLPFVPRSNEPFKTVRLPPKRTH